MEAEKAPAALRDRLQPALLDRLIDHAPGDAVDSPETRAISRVQLRAAVLRDLSWLFNAIRAEPAAHSVRDAEIARWRQAPEVGRSVVNYGLPAFAGTGLSSLRAHEIERSVSDAILAFEPRIDPESLEVMVALDSGDSRHNTLEIFIRARIWGQPLPQDMLVAADVDVESGHTRLRELRDPRGLPRSTPRGFSA